MEPGIKAEERARLLAELAELARAETECLCRAVALVQGKAPGAEIRAIYAEVEAARAGKNRVLRQLSSLAPIRTEEAKGLLPPGQRSGRSAADARPYLQNDEQRRGRFDVNE